MKFLSATANDVIERRIMQPHVQPRVNNSNQEYQTVYYAVINDCVE